MLLLSLATSSGNFNACLCENDKVISEASEDNNNRTPKMPHTLIDRLLADTSVDIAQIEAIAVDIGPGGLGATRSGVAYANALAFARHIPVFGFLSFDILHFQIEKSQMREQNPDLPVLCLLKASGGNIYSAYFQENKPPVYHFGQKITILDKIIPKHNRVIVAGRGRDIITDSAYAIDSGFELVYARTLAALALKEVIDMQKPYFPLFPVNEESEIFHE